MRLDSDQARYTQISDRYEISHELGRGGMAVVYLARQTDLDRWVALKELHPEPRDASIVRRFLRESRLAGSLSHPNIVTVLDFFERDGVGYIAMEYVPRGSLRPYVGTLTLAQTAGVLEGILAALTCAEHGGIVHRDLKPENVMITWDGRVKLTDFGIAKATTAASMLTVAGTTLGTPHYMAPEQAMAQEVGAWTDLYSVGCMAYELFTGQLPFADTEAPTAILLRHVNDVPPPPNVVRADLDAGVSDWICGLLEKDPTLRPPSAAAAWEALEEIVLALEGPRWRRSSALPQIDGGGEVPGPFTPPPSSAVPNDSVFTTFDPQALAPSAPAPSAPGEIAQSGPSTTPPPGAVPPAAPGAPDERAPSEPYVTPSPAPAPGAMTPAPGPGGPPLPSDSVWRVTPPPATPPGAATPSPSPTPPGAVTPAPGRAEPPLPSDPGWGATPPPAPPGAMTPTHGSAGTPLPSDPGWGAMPPPAPLGAVTPAHGPAGPALPSDPGWGATPPPTPPGAPAPGAPSPSEPALTLPPRNAPEPAPPTPRRRGRRVAVVASATVLAGAAAAAAIVLPGEDEPPPRREQAAVAPPVPLAAGPVQLTLPAGWQELAVPVAVPGLRLTDGRAAAPSSGGAVLAGLAPRDAHTPALLSGELLDALGLRSGVVPDREAVRLGDYAAYRYEGLRPRGLGRAVTVYAAPTTAGVATVACIAPLTPADCERAAETLRVSSAKGFALGPDRTFGDGINGVLAQLDGALRSHGDALRAARRAPGQAAAAKRIAGDYRAASAALAENAPSPADQGALDELVRATRAAGSAYGDLAAAADAVGPRTYRSAASRARAAERRLASALDALEDGGYETLTRPRPRSIPPLRRPRAVQPDDPGPTDPGPSDPGPSDPGPSDPGPSDPGPSDPGPSDPGPSDPGPSDPGPTDPDEGKPEPDPIDPDFGGSEG